MNRNHALSVCIALACISVALAAFYYPRLPAVMPTHWDVAGHANGYMPKFWGVVVYPAILVVICVQLVAFPMISPNSFRLDRSIGTFNLIMAAIALTVLAVGVLAMQAALGTPLPMQRLVPGVLGLFFLVLGNYMAKFRKNFFMGIRTPWTLASDEVWARTHRLGGRLWTTAGLVMIVQAVAGINSIAILYVVIALVVVIPFAYSFVIYKRIEGFKGDALL